MDGEEEVIETSDSEEREALRTGQLDYWQHAVDDIRARNPVYAPSSTRFSLLYNVPSPRKRPRLDTLPTHGAYYVREFSPSPHIPVQLDDNDKHSRSPSLIPPTSPSDGPTSLGDRSPKSSPLVPLGGNAEEIADDMDLEFYAKSQDPMDMFRTQYRDVNSVNYVAFQRGPSSQDGTSQTGGDTHERRRARSRSRDPLSPFSSCSSSRRHNHLHQHTPHDAAPATPERVENVADSPQRPLLSQSMSPSLTPPPLGQRPTSSPTPATPLPPSNHYKSPFHSPIYSPRSPTGSPSAVRVTPLPLENPDIPLFTPQPVRHHRSYKFSSLTPPPGQQWTSSPLLRTPARQSSPLSRFSSPILAADTETGDEVVANEEGGGRRYSMRERRPQQINPYAYDQIIYKRQMKSNPDAIVKIRRFESPQRRGKFPGRLDGGQPSDGAGEDDGTQGWSMDIDVEEEESWVERSRKRNRSHSRSEEARPSEPPAALDLGWLPEALRDLSSSDDDDPDVRDLLREAKREKRKAKRLEREAAAAKEREERETVQNEREAKLRSKPFPLRKGKERAHVTDEDERELNAIRTQSLTSRPHRQLHTPPRHERPKRMSPAISISSQALPHSPRNSSPPGVNGDEPKFDFNGGYDDPGDEVWAGHANDGGGNYQFESPLRPRHSMSLSSAKSSTVGAGADSIRARSWSQSQSDADNSSSPGFLNASKRKALGRMMPNVMVNKMVNEARKKQAPPPKRMRSAIVESDVEEGPLLPGQTRVRIGERGKNLDIKGDTESEESESHNPALSDGDNSVQFDSDAEEGHPKGPKKSSLKPQHVPYLSDHSMEESSGDEVDDTKIQAWLANRQRPGVHVMKRVGLQPRAPRAEGHLVDYMLAGTRTIGARGRSTVQKKTSSLKYVTKSQRTLGGRSGLNIVTSRPQKKQQTLLSFGGHGKVKTRREKGGGQSRHPGVPRKENAGAHVDEESEPEILIYRIGGMESAADAAARKKRKDTKRAGAGQYTFAQKNTHITSGRRRTLNAITVDVEDEGFHRALAPVRNSTRPVPRQVNNISGVRRNHDGSTMSEPEVLQVNSELSSPQQRLHKRHQPLPSVDHRRDIKLDFDIHFLPSGISFAPNTFIGKGRLNEVVTLISGGDSVFVPNSYAAHGIELGPSTSNSDLSQSLVAIVDGLLNYTLGPVENHTTGDTGRWENLIYVAGQLLTLLPSQSTMEECLLLDGALQEQFLRLVTLVEERDELLGYDDGSLSVPLLNIYWFAIEMLVRFSCSMQKSHPELTIDMKNLIKYISLLVDRLHSYGMERTLEPVLGGSEKLDAHLIPQRTAELWVCLFHLISNCEVNTSDDSSAGQQHPFWRVIFLALQRTDTAQSALEASESTWRTIFSLCALSQFSVHGMTTSTCRLPASWHLVDFALGKIRLGVDPETDRDLPDRTLDKRDEYVWMIASRCFILSSRWHWQLDEASSMFNHLADIFRSRKFANLRREASDFPAFMLKNDMQLLSKYKSSDTAFQIFLKLVAQAFRDGSSTDVPAAQRLATGKLNKLLALAIPVGSVSFTKTAPPTVHELSMLYNRFSAVAVAIHLNPSPANIRNRLSHARRFVNFKEADDTTRVACIRGMMHFAILMCHHHVALDEVLSWLAEMTIVLADEYRDIDVPTNKAVVEPTSTVAKHRTVFSIQVLLGAIRRIIETSATDLPGQYPDPALLSGPWITRLFSSMSLTSAANTGLEIRALVQSFLDARRAAMPNPQRRIAVVASEESQESQDYYGDFDLDLDDPELQAALGNDVFPALKNENTAKDQIICNVIDTHIAPVIYRMVCKHFSDPLDTSSFEEYCREADGWVDCWVGCANIIVKNGKRKWDSYLQLGSMSWERIIDPSWRRRIGLRFMFMFLRLDPGAYTEYADRFVVVLLESLVAVKVTLEHEYMSLLFSVDGLQHPLLRRIPCQPRPGTSDYEISVLAFMALRTRVLDVVFTNLAKEMRTKEYHLRQIQTYIGFIISMLSTMKDVHEQTIAGSEEQATHSTFCRDVYGKLQQHPKIMTEPRLGTSLTWIQSI